MKKLLTFILCFCMLGGLAAAEDAETIVIFNGDVITVNGETITEDASAPVYLALEVETHKDVPKELEGLSNRVVTITDAGSYRFSGTASDVQIAVRAGEDDRVRVILDGVDLTCRTASVFQGYTAYDPRTPGEYGLTIELADGSENILTGSHTVKINDDDIKHDGAVDSLISLGFEGSGSLIVNADNEGVEVKYGHMTINGGTFRIEAGDDPLNVSEDGVGTLTVNDGYLYSNVRPAQGGEGDGIDSNGYIVFNGGTIINLAHPDSGDSGIDSDMGSSINGGIVVGAGNMYDPIETGSMQRFMMLEFTEETDDLVVVTDANDNPVFAYDFPYSYTYIAFSTPELTEGEYHVYLGGEIVGEQSDGLYTSIESYTPGSRMVHGGGTAQPQMGGFDPGAMKMGEMPDGMQQPQGGMADIDAYMKAINSIDLNELLKDVDLNALLEGKDLNQLLTGFGIQDLLSEEQIAETLGDVDLNTLNVFGRGGRGGMGGGMMGGPRRLESSADVATDVFLLTPDTNGFTNITAK